MRPISKSQLHVARLSLMMMYKPSPMQVVIYTVDHAAQRADHQRHSTGQVTAIVACMSNRGEAMYHSAG